jgi:hypothetical protein
MLKALIDRRTRLDVLGQGVKITLHDSAGSRKANWNDVGTCAIPSVMRPTVIDGVPYVDGAVVSPTNAERTIGDGSRRRSSQC